MKPQANHTVPDSWSGSRRRAIKSRRAWVTCAVIVSIIVAVTSVTMAPTVSAQDVYSEKTLEISRKLQCPVCAGQSVADSSSQLASQMRDIIEQKVQAGESEAQIIDFFVARYGPDVVTEPPKSGFSLVLWSMPLLVVVLGALVVGLFIRERTRHASPGDRPPRSDALAPQDDEELEAIARDVLRPQAGEGVPGA